MKYFMTLNYHIIYYEFLKPFRSILIFETFKFDVVFFFQEYCYDNMNFTKVFQKMVMLLYKSKNL